MITVFIKIYRVPSF